MSLVGFKSQNHPQQTRYAGSRRHVDDRALPASDFVTLNSRFGFTVDAAAASHNAKLPRFYSEENCGLSASWAGERVYCNPPYSDIRPWIQKAWDETEAGIIVMLLPANRTEQRWWIDLVEPLRDKLNSPLSTEFLPGRLRFLKPGQTEIKPNERPPFGCVLLIWNFEQVRGDATLPRPKLARCSNGQPMESGVTDGETSNFKTPHQPIERGWEMRAIRAFFGRDGIDPELAKELAELIRRSQSGLPLKRS